jgi:hypothetical protein
VEYYPFRQFRHELSVRAILTIVFRDRVLRRGGKSCRAFFLAHPPSDRRPLVGLPHRLSPPTNALSTASAITGYNRQVFHSTVTIRILGVIWRLPGGCNAKNAKTNSLFDSNTILPESEALTFGNLDLGGLPGRRKFNARHNTNSAKTDSPLTTRAENAVCYNEDRKMSKTEDARRYL